MSDVTIKTNANGPLLVSGAVTLTDHEGGVYDLAGKDVIALCRCNASKNRPFCDGSHRECGFDAADLAPKKE